MPRTRFALSKTTLISLAALLATLMWLMGRQLVPEQVIDFSPILEQYFECQTQAENNRAALTVFIGAESVAKNLAKSLCANVVVAKQFGKVRAVWNHNEDQVLQYVGKGIADLALVKENLMEAVKGESTYGYRVVAAYPDYPAYLIAMREQPRISKEYLLDKRIGLLDYPTSRSGHIIPIQMFKSLNLNLDNMQITYANSHSELRNLLTSGRVDIVSSYWQDSDEAILSRNYITPIEQQVSGSKWYLKMETNNIDLFCAIQQTLIQVAHDQDSSYFSQLTAEPRCQA
ncbi:type 2 periplasmic-binding domain-containing protein [Bowmanella dokdonensis]|uniref:Uncharacterized protein n=1 Tax=Bowmanella dokdonensis TaxID=751969 RepID=A0A939IQX1_9ALTE|nr:hypothetical protein [Bowmanella dokdonensis]MBN7825509.1 hypothetical protein [Bowmanella dokdonensis]